jgi:hypothetical protein
MNIKNSMDIRTITPAMNGKEYFVVNNPKKLTSQSSFVVSSPLIPASDIAPERLTEAVLELDGSELISYPLPAELLKLALGLVLLILEVDEFLYSTIGAV